MVEDEKGFIWIATDKGLKRYDGNKLKNIHLHDSIDDNFVRIIHRTSSNHGKKTEQLLCVNYYGQLVTVNIKDTYTDPLTFKVNYQEQNAGFYQSIIVTKNEVVFDYQDPTHGKTFILNEQGRMETLPFNHIDKLIALKKNGTSLFRKEKYIIRKCSTITDTLFTLSNDYFFSAVVEWNHEDILFFYDKGYLLGLNVSDHHIRQIARIDSIKNGLYIHDIATDSHGNVWLFTKKGACLVNRKREVSWFLTGIDISSGFESRDASQYWFAGKNGIYHIPKVSHLNTLAFDFKIESIHHGLKGLYLVSGDGKLYLKTAHHITFLFDLALTQAKGLKIIKILEGKTALVVMSNDGYVILNEMPFVYDSPEGMMMCKRAERCYYLDVFLVKANDIVKANDSLFYLSRWGYGGLYELKLQAKYIKLTQLKDVNSSVKSLVLDNGTVFFSNNYKLLSYNLAFPYSQLITSRRTEIAQFTKIGSRFIMGFVNKGVGVYDQGKYVQYTAENSGLLSNEITEVQQHKGKIWINSSGGLQEMMFEKDTALFYTPEFTLPKPTKVTFNGDSIYLFYKGNPKEVNILHRNHFPKKRKPFLYIESVTCHNLNQSDSSVILPYFKNDFSIQLGVLSYDHIKNKYYYQLINGKDSSGFRLSKDGYIHFNALEPGKYTLQFFSKNSNLVTSNLLSYQFEVEQPFWGTSWFKLSIIALVSLLVGIGTKTYYHRKHKRQKEQQEGEYKILQLEQQLFKSLMNPHFIFNSLNAIQSLVNTNRPKEASDNISRFSQLVRKNLEDSVEGFCSLEEELARIKLYVEIENVRFNQCITLLFEIEETLLIQHIKVPSFILQPLVENSILHGILPNGGGEIIIRTKMLTGNQLELNVLDNGIGLEASLKKGAMKEKTSMAISLISKRLNKLRTIENKTYDFDITNRYEYDQQVGTIVTIRLPLMTLNQ